MGAWALKADIRGPRGYDVEMAQVDTDDHLRLWLSDGTVIDAGVARGPQGLDGVNGVANDTATGGYIGTTSSATQVAGDKRWLTALNAQNAGVVGDGTTDDTAALQAFVNSAAAFGVTAMLAPLSTVLVQDAIIVPNGLRLDLNKATIKRGATGSAVLLQLLDRSNVTIQNGTLDGDKASYAPVTEWRHNLNLDNSQNVTIRDVRSVRAKGDGIYVGGTVTSCANVNLISSVFDQNHRNGLSIIGVDGFTATACRFTNTSGTAPQSGVDVEPNLAGQICTNIAFNSCTFTGNTGHGFLVSLVPTRTAAQGGITLTGCTLDNNTTAGVRLTESDNFKMLGGSLSGNFQGFLHDTNTVNVAKLVGVAIRKNKQHGVAITGVYNDLVVSDCTMDSNGQTTTGDGINVAPSASSAKFRFIGNWVGGSTQRNGITLGANVSGVALIGNHYVGNGTAARSVGTFVTLDLDEAAVVNVTGSRAGNAALGSLLAQLKARGLITDSTTA